MLLHDSILQNAASHGDRPALWRGDVMLTYGEFGTQIRETSNSLTKIGISKNERIAVYLDKRVEGVVACFAASLAGAVFVPINPVLKPAQVAHILNDCTVSMLVTSGNLARTLKAALQTCSSLRNIVVVDDDDRDLRPSPNVALLTWTGFLENSGAGTTSIRCIDNDIAAIFYTSGSTGKPKGVVLSHRNMSVGAESVAGYLENTPEDVILAALPFSFDAGFSQLTTAFSAGASAILFDYLLPQDVPRAVVRFGATGLTGVPPLWNQVSKLQWPAEAAEKLRYIANTGGAMPTATLERLRALLPKTKVFLMYGLTESFRSTYLPPEELDRRPTSIGKAIPNAEVLVVRENGSLCDPGEPGELVHRGALVSLGYWNDPDRSAARFRPVPNLLTELPFAENAVWSGDTVQRDEDGFIYFIGRKDDMIKSSGYRISPTEVEEIVFKTGLVTECAALGIPHPDLGQAVVVVALSQTGGDDANDTIIAACKQALPNFMVPASIVWRESLPKNPNGKIDRKQLVGELQDLYQEDR